MRSGLQLAILASVLLLVAGTASATSLLTNGDFETGTLAGWTATDLAGGSGSFFVSSDVTTPISGFPTVGPAAGLFYAVSDEGGPGTHALSQSFTVAPGSRVILSFDMFVNDWSDLGPIIGSCGLDHISCDANQHARVDILASGSSPFDTGAGVLANFYLSVDPGADPNSYTSYLFDITGVVGGGGTFVLRFAEVDNQFFFNQGVDNVSIEATGTVVPEPTTGLLLGAGLLALAAARLHFR
jgi:PEP-CTERM motif